MATIRKIKRRMRGIQSTQKITRAMKMVAATKLRRAQIRAENVRPFFAGTLDILRNVAAAIEPEAHPLLHSREVKKSCVIAITADRGLCGGYNSKIVKLVTEQFARDEALELIAIGKRGRDYFRRFGYEIGGEYTDIPDYPPFSLAKDLAHRVIDDYTAEKYDRIFLAYTRFYSTLTQIPELVALLPLERQDINAGQQIREYIMEPGPTEVLDIILPRYVENLIYGALLESKASEFGARMTAMDAATENAQEMVDNLNVLYNRARQEEITLEMLEIVGGAEALK